MKSLVSLLLVAPALAPVAISGKKSSIRRRTGAANPQHVQPPSMCCALAEPRRLLLVLPQTQQGVSQRTRLLERSYGLWGGVRSTFRQPLEYRLHDGSGTGDG